VADLSGKNYQVDERAAEEDPEILAMIAPYKKTLDAKMTEIIGELDEQLVKSRPNSKLGNWFTDVLKEEAILLTGKPVDFAIQNYGGIRVPSLSKGPISVGKIYELMPFDNMLIVVELDGKATKLLVDKIAELNGWPISDGLSFSIEDGKSKDVTISGKPWKESDTYYVGIPDYIANGGDDCDFLLDYPRENTGKYIREVVIDHLRRKKVDGKKIIIDPTKRILTQ